jgi:hypothetical protein
MFDVDLKQTESIMQLTAIMGKNLEVQNIRLYFYKHKERDTLCKLTRTRYYQISFSPFARGKLPQVVCIYVFSQQCFAVVAYSDKAERVYCVVKSSSSDRKKQKKKMGKDGVGVRRRPPSHPLLLLRATV